MQELTQGNKSLYWSTEFIRELYRHGVEHLLISPGSRSTPLVMAAAIHPGINKQVVLDERSAAFAALGIGKSTGSPAALVCTSGTALANYFPAVVEARQSGVPLIVLSADRPPSLRNIGASQAIDQLKIFGQYPVFFHEMGEPAADESDLRRLRQAAGQAVSRARNQRGPVHLNFAFRKPLEPDPDFAASLKEENVKETNAGFNPPATSVSTAAPVPYSMLPGEVRSVMEQSARPVIVAGPQNPFCTKEPIRRLAEQLHAPLLAEPGSPRMEQSIRGYSGFLRSDSLAESLEPDLILRFGQSPVGKAVLRYLERHNQVPHIHFAAVGEWQDPVYSVTHRVETYPISLHSDLPFTPADPEWTEQWKQAESLFSGHREAAIGSASGFTDGHVFAEITRAVPESWNLFASNSFPVRDLELFGHHGTNTVFVNRGASGIDGVISTALGATMASETPGVLFIGDLAFLHDSNAMLSADMPGETPLVIFLLNNAGGNIFRMLPIADHTEYFTSYFETPQNAGIEHLAKAHDIPYVRAGDVESLKIAAGDLFRDVPSGTAIVECVTDSTASMNLRRTIWNFNDG